MKWVKRVIWIVLAAAVAVAVAFALRPLPPRVSTEAASRGRFVETVEEDGKTRVKQRYVVSSPMSGDLARITLKPGAEVTDETVIASIQPAAPPLIDARSKRELQARLAAARVGQKRAEAEASRVAAAEAWARKELGRTRELSASGVATRSELDRALLESQSQKRALEASKLATRVARYEVEMARAALSSTEGSKSNGALEVRSPIRGRVLKVVRESRGVVRAGDRLVEVADPGSLEVVVDVLTSDAVRVSPGQPVNIVRWGGDEALRGRVRIVEPGAFTKVSALGVEEQRVWVVIDIVTPRERWVQLGDGYRVEVEIEVRALDDALKIPVSALFRDGERWAVFALDGSVARKRPVELEARGALEAVVKSGLREGDRVIVHPDDAILDGTEVEAR